MKIEVRKLERRDKFQVIYYIGNAVQTNPPISRRAAWQLLWQLVVALLWPWSPISDAVVDFNPGRYSRSLRMVH